MAVEKSPLGVAAYKSTQEQPSVALVVEKHWGEEQDVFV